MKLSSICIVTLLILGSHFNVNAGSSEDILTTVKILNQGLLEHDTSVIHDAYSDEIEWENSYGWTIRSKEKLVKFFDEWMFKQYPKSSVSPQVKYQITRLSDNLSWIDLVQRIQIEDNVLHIRQVHLLVKQGNQWKISKTRIWRLRHSDNPPTDYIKELDLFED